MRIRPTRTRLALAIAATALLGAAACSTSNSGARGTKPSRSGVAQVITGAGSPSSAGGVTLDVGELGSVNVDKALLAASGQDKGMNYSISWSLFPTGGGGFLEAVPSGSVDLALMADTPPIFGQVAGVQTKVVGVEKTLVPGKSYVEIFAPKNSDIHSMADLKGKKVALTEGTILQYTVLGALKKAGLSYHDITPVNLAPTDAITAFQNGDVDATAALGPQLAQLEAAGDRVIGSGEGITTGYQYAVAASAALSNPTKRAEITDYLQRIGRAQQWADAHRAEWTKDYAQVVGLPQSVAKIIVDRQQYSWIPIDKSVIAAQQKEADAYTNLGLIKSKLDVSSEFDPSLNSVLAK